MHEHSPKQDPQRWVQDHPKSGKPFDSEVGLNVTMAFGIGIVVISVLSMIGMWFLIASFNDSPGDGEAARVQQTLPPEPRLQIHAEADLQAFLDEQNNHLQSSGWIDQAQDRGHIAIEDAMRLIAEQGLTVRSNPRQWQDPALWRDQSLLHLGEEVH